MSLGIDGYTVRDDDDDDPVLIIQPGDRIVDTWRENVAPWIVVKSNDKKRAWVNAMRYVLSKFDYHNKDHEVVGRPDPLIVGRALAD